MIEVGPEYLQAVNSDVVVKVEPVVKVTWSDSKNLENIKSISSADKYSNFLKKNASIWVDCHNENVNSSTKDLKNNASVSFNNPFAFTFRNNGIVKGNYEDSYSLKFGTSSKVTVTPNNYSSLNREEFALECLLNFKSCLLPQNNGTYWVWGQAQNFTNQQFGIRVLRSAEGSFLQAFIVNEADVLYVHTDTQPLNTSTDYYCFLFFKNNEFHFVVNEREYGPIVTVGKIKEYVGPLTAGMTNQDTMGLPSGINLQHLAYYNTCPFLKRSGVVRYFMAINTGEQVAGFNYFSPEEATNGYCREQFSWAVLDAKDEYNIPIGPCLDHTAVEIDYKDKHFEYGWWGRRLSGAAGELSSPEVLLTSFDPIKLNVFTIYTSEHFGKIKRFSAWYKDSVTKNWVNIFDNAEMIEYFVSKSFDQPITVEAIYIEVYSTRSSNDVVRILEISPTYEEYISDDVISFSVSKVRDQYDSTIPFGVTANNTFSLVIDNINQKFNRNNQFSSIYNLLKPEVKIEAWLKYVNPVVTQEYLGGGYGDGEYGFSVYGGPHTEIQGTPGQSEEILEMGVEVYGGEAATVEEISQRSNIFATIPLGTFYVDDIVGSSELTVTFNCRDFSKYFQDDTTKGFLFKETTVSNAMETLARSGGMARKKIKVQKNYFEMIECMRPVHHWRFQDIDNTTIAMYNKESTDTFRLTPFLQTKQLGTIKNLFELDSNDQLTVEFWIYTSSIADKILFSISTGTLFSPPSGNQQFTIRNPKNLKIIIPTNQFASQITLTTGLNVADSKWHHVAVAWDSSDDNNKGRVVVYIDGVKSYSSLGSPQATVFNSKLMSNIQFLDSEIEAYIADARIWSFNKNNSNVIETANKTLRGYESGLSALWRVTTSPGQDNKTLCVENKAAPSVFMAREGLDKKVPIYKVPINCFIDSINSCHLTDMGNVSATAGNIIKLGGGALDNDDSSDSAYFNNSYAVGFNNLNLATLTQCSIVGIIKCDDFSSEKIIFTSGSSFGNIKIGTSTAGQLFCKISGVGTFYSTKTINVNEWTHFCVTHEKTSSTSAKTQIFINGVSAGQSLSLGNSNAIFGSTVGIGAEVDQTKFFKGYISEFSILEYALSAEDVSDLYIASLAPKMNVFPLIYSKDESIWDTMLKTAFPDFGMFYIDEEENFVYETGPRLNSEIYPRHTIPQYILSDESQIKSGSEMIQLMANHVEVKVYNSKESTGVRGLWSPPENESLGVTYLTANISKFDTQIKYKIINSEDDQSISIPYFPKSGIIRIADEFIKYSSRKDGTLLNCERGYFDSIAAEHSLGDGIFETKEYDVQFSETPAYAVKYPFITLEKEKQAIIHSFTSTSYNAKIVISASTSDLSPRYLILNGQDGDNAQWFMSIAGTVVSVDSSEQQINTPTAKNKEFIDRYRLKVLIIDNQYINNIEIAQSIADYLLDTYQSGVQILDVEVVGLPHLQLSDRINIEKFELLNINNKDYWVIESNIEYDGGISHSMKLREV